MSIIKTITWDYEFAHWLKQSDSYRNNFTFEGANALQAYLDELSDDIGEDVEFDPVAWCCEWTEYDSLAEAYKECRYDYTYVEDEARDYFNYETFLIELDNGHVLVMDF